MKFTKIQKYLAFLLTILFSLLLLSPSMSVERRKKGLKGKKKARNKPKTKNNTNTTASSPSSAFDAKSLNCSNPILKDVCTKLFLNLDPKLIQNVTQFVAKDTERTISFQLPAFQISTQSLLPKEISWLTNAMGILNFSFPKPTIMLHYGPKSLAARFSTQVDVLDIKAIDLDVIGMKLNSGFTVVASFSAKFTILTKILNKILQEKKQPALTDKNPITWFQDSSIALMLSSGIADFKAIPAEFKPAYINLASIPSEGTNEPQALLLASLKFIDNKSNAITNFLKTVLFPNDVKISALLSSTGISIFCGVTDISYKNKEIELTKAGFSMKFEFGNPQSPTVAVEAEIKVPVSMKGEKEKNFLSLYGKMDLTPLEIGFDMQMKSIWVNAFGFTRFSIGNIRFRTKANIQTGVPTSYAFGAEIAIGVSCFALNSGNIEWKGKGHCIKVIGQVGISTLTPEDNYYYGDLEFLSIKTIALAFAGGPQNKDEIKVPDLLEDSTKLEKLKASYSLKDQKVGLITINKGLFVTGTAISFAQSCDFTLSLNLANKTKMTFSYTLDYSKPFVFGEAFILSSPDKKRGPFMRFNMGEKITDNGTHFSGEFDAGVKIFGIEAAAKVTMGKDSFAFRVKGKIYDALEAEFNVESLYQTSSKKIRTKAKGDFVMNDSLKDIIKRAAQKALDSFREVKKKANEMNPDNRNIFEKALNFNIKDLFANISGFGEDLTNKITSKIKDIGAKAAAEALARYSETLDLFKITRISFDLDVNIDEDKKNEKDKKSVKLNAKLEGHVFNTPVTQDITLSFDKDGLNVSVFVDVFLAQITNLFKK